MNCFFRNQHEALYNATKPYQYVGGEFLSRNKDFDSAKVRFAFVFPDKYEIGISNLGVRIIYDRVNAQEGMMADRAYAPEPDFKPDFLYAVESKRALKDFDGTTTANEIGLPVSSNGLVLPCGASGRWEAKSDFAKILEKSTEPSERVIFTLIRLSANKPISLFTFGKSSAGVRSTDN